jgi:DNA polymerase-4
MSKVLHLDMDSFFATVEQQARPSLRGKAVGIAPVDSPGGTIVAASIEAKKFGVKTGTKVAEARELIPGITILPPTPERYRAIHRRFRAIMQQYRGVCKPRSVDEIALWLEPQESAQAAEIATEIKQRIRNQVGEWLSSSVGIGPNWLLAKTASDYQKPDGLFEIDQRNIREVLAGLDLTDLCGIAYRTAARMNLAGIATPLDLYDLPPWELKRRLGMIGYYWHLRVRGYAIDTEDWGTKTLGHSSVLPKPTADPAHLKALLHKLTHRIARRLRSGHWQAQAVTISGPTRQDSYGLGSRFAREPTLRPDMSRISGGSPSEMYQKNPHWVHTVRLTPTDRHHDIFGAAWKLMTDHPPGAPLGKLAVTTHGLRPADPEQPSLFDIDRRRGSLSAGADAVNDRWGEFTLIPAGMMGTDDVAGDSIAFGQDLKLQRETQN